MFLLWHIQKAPSNYKLTLPSSDSGISVTVWHSLIELLLNGGFKKDFLEHSQKSGAHLSTSMLTSKHRWKTTMIQDSRTNKYSDPSGLKICINSPYKEFQSVLAKQNTNPDEH